MAERGTICRICNDRYRQDDKNFRVCYTLTKDMFGALADLIADLKNYSPEKVILFGSYARGEADRFSDLDVLIIKETEKTFLDRLKEVALLLRNSLPPVNIFVYNKREIKLMQREENSFINRILKEGRVIYEA